MFGRPVDNTEKHLQWMSHRGLLQDTQEKRRRLIRRVEDHVGKPLLDATEADLQEWRATLNQAPGTVCALIGGVREFYRWAVLEDLLAVDPSRRLMFPRRPPHLPRPIPEDELELALAAAYPRVRPCSADCEHKRSRGCRWQTSS